MVVLMSACPAMTWAMCGGQSAADGVGDENPPEVVRVKVQGAAVGVGQAGGVEDVVEAFAEELAVHGGDLAAAVVLEQQRHGGIPHAFVVVVGGDLRDGAGPQVADPGDDGAQDVGEFGADQQDTLLVRLRGGDLQQGHDFARRGQPVLDQAVMTGLQHLLDPGSGVLQELDRRPSPEGPALPLNQILAPPVDVVDPGGIWPFGAGEGLAEDLEPPAGGSRLDGLQSSLGVVQQFSRGADNCWQGRQALPGALVHAGFDPLALLLDVEVGLPDRAGRDPRTPAGRLLPGPLGEIQIEGPDRDQQVGTVQAGGHDLVVGAVAAAPPHGLRLRPLLPLRRHLRRQVQRVDPRMMRFQVGPEVQSQEPREVVQRRVVEPGPALREVVHQQIAHRPAGKVVAVDELLDTDLAGGPAQVPERCRSIIWETAEAAKPGVEQGVPCRLGVVLPQSRPVLQRVTDRDVGRFPALRHHDLDQVVHSPAPCRRSPPRGAGQRLQSCESLRITHQRETLLHVPRSPGQLPGQRRPQHIGENDAHQT
ncbi:hypothetical protein [Streptomyces canus]|uniref:hypothetical protein n=1 Tax=Streptomyces canus TaxID=58343 RepID=UPI0038309D91